MAKGYKYLITAITYFLARVGINLLFHDPVMGKYAIALIVETILFSATYHIVMHYALENKGRKQPGK